MSEAAAREGLTRLFVFPYQVRPGGKFMPDGVGVGGVGETALYGLKMTGLSCIDTSMFATPRRYVDGLSCSPGVNGGRTAWHWDWRSRDYWHGFVRDAPPSRTTSATCGARPSPTRCRRGRCWRCRCVRGGTRACGGCARKEGVTMRWARGRAPCARTVL